MNKTLNSIPALQKRKEGRRKRRRKMNRKKKTVGAGKKHSLNVKQNIFTQGF